VSCRRLGGFGYEQSKRTSKRNSQVQVFVWTSKSSFGGRRICYKRYQLYAPQMKILEVRRTFGNAFSKCFSKVFVLDLGYVPLKSSSKIRSQTFVRSSKTSFGEHKLNLHMPTPVTVHLHVKLFQNISTTRNFIW
jgi:hypothetical protein